MALSDNMQYLRKREKITQEELADRLGVSRQAVSKWETGEAYPETDKLIVLCDMFGVSLDELVRGDLTKGKEQAVPAEAVTKGFIKQIDSFSRAISAGVLLILIGTALSVALAGIGMQVESFSRLSGALIGTVVLLFVAVAVFLFVYYGMKYDSFRKEHPTMEGVFTQSEIKAYTKKFNVSMACLVSCVLLDVVFLVMFSALIDAGIIAVENADASYCFLTSAFLGILAFIVFGFVYNGIQHIKYNVNEYNSQNNKDMNHTPRSKLKDAICGAVMLSATAVFLVLGFVGGWWHPGWVVFPVGGIICAIIGTIMGAKDGD